jgi:hypothetical protein
MERQIIERNYMNRKFWTVFIVWQVVAELFCWCPRLLFHLPHDSVIGIVFGGVGAWGLMPGKLLAMELLWTLHLKINQIPALGIIVEVTLNLLVWLAFAKLAHGISFGFKGIEGLVVPNSETWRRVKERFYKTRFYLLGFLVMYCAFRRTFRPNGWFLLIVFIGFLVLFSVFLHSVVTAFKKRKELGYKGFVLPIFCLATIFVSFRYMPNLGVVVRDAEFRARIADYNSVVDAIKTGKVSSTKDGDDITYQVDLENFKNLPSTVQRIWGVRRGDCELRIYFYTEHVGGALGTTMGFVYSEPLKKAPCKKAFSTGYPEYLTSMTGKWYSFFKN